METMYITYDENTKNLTGASSSLPEGEPFIEISWEEWEKIENDFWYNRGGYFVNVEEQKLVFHKEDATKLRVAIKTERQEQVGEEMAISAMPETAVMLEYRVQALENEVQELRELVLQLKSTIATQ